jgi:hypothetical protein
VLQPVYLPTPSRFDVLETPMNRLVGIAGEAFAVLNNGWACMNELTVLLEKELRDAGAKDTLHFRTPHAQPSPDDYLGEIASKVSGAITGLGN